MFLRILLVVPEGADADLRTLFRSHPIHSTAILGRVSAEVAVESIRRYIPDVVIVDADAENCGLLSGWTESVDERTALICLSETVEHAIVAFRAGAVHYLLAPAGEQQSHDALSRAAARLHAFDLAQMNTWNSTAATYRTPQAPYRCQVIALPSNTSIAVRSSEDVVSAHGEGNYTRVMLREEPPVILSKCLGDVERELKDVGLMRIHRSHMVNVDLIRTVRRGKQPVVQLINGSEVEVGERYKEVLYDALGIGRYHRH